MFYQFFIDDLEIDEPEGYSDIAVVFGRHEQWHGVFIEASLSELKFRDDARDYLSSIWQSKGMKGQATFKAYSANGVYDELKLDFEGRLDFMQYHESCGDDCYIAFPAEQSGCALVFKNMFAQKVDMESPVAFDGLTTVDVYDKLGSELTLKARELEVLVKGSVKDAGDTATGEIFDVVDNGPLFFMFRPIYENGEKNSIATGQLIPFSPEGWLGLPVPGTVNNFIDISPQLLFEENPNCFSGTVLYSFRQKGNFNIKTDENVQFIRLKVITWDGNGNIFQNSTVLHSFLIASNINPGVTTGYSNSFDQSFSGSMPPVIGMGLYAFLEFEMSVANQPTTFEISYVFDKETNVDISATKACPDTTVKAFAINESMSHIAEVITNSCYKVKSDYYGRYDSRPYSSVDDGCGSLRVLFPGLFARNAPDSKFFLSFQDIFEGLNPIDNIGIGIEKNDDDIEWIRVEKVDYFYKDVEILRLPAVPHVEFNADQKGFIATIKSGYTKWEAEDVNGLDEPNSDREYRTTLTASSQLLTIQSPLVAASYPLEVARIQSFVETGGADTKWDNETFIVCVSRNGYGEFIVEQGNIVSPANIFSPSTVYNWRIRPYSNLQRWFKSIANSYANLVDSDNILHFTKGAGNYLAEGELEQRAYSPICKLENGVKAENDDIGTQDFADQIDATPLWRPILANFTYQISLHDYRQLKLNPYGYVSFQCGNGDWFKGFISNIQYKLAGANQGEADITLKLKW